jgi:hypothetical protein
VNGNLLSMRPSRGESELNTSIALHKRNSSVNIFLLIVVLALSELGESGSLLLPISITLAS